MKDKIKLIKNLNTYNNSKKLYLDDNEMSNINDIVNNINNIENENLKLNQDFNKINNT